MNEKTTIKEWLQTIAVKEHLNKKLIVKFQLPNQKPVEITRVGLDIYNKLLEKSGWKINIRVTGFFWWRKPLITILLPR